MTMCQNSRHHQQRSHRRHKNQGRSRANRPHRKKPDQPPAHRAAPVKRDILRRSLMAQPAHRRLPQKINHHAASRNLRAHIKEDRQRPQPQMAEPQRTTIRAVATSRPTLKQLRKIYKRRQHRHRKRAYRQNHIRHPHRTRQLGSRSTGSNKNKRGTNLRRNRRSKRIQETAEIQSRSSRLRRSQRPHIWIDRNLQQREPAPHNKQRKQKQRIKNNHRSRQKEQQSNPHHRQRHHNPALIPNLPHNRARRKRHHKVRAEETQLDHQRLHIR